jgi:hypothetical protein
MSRKSLFWAISIVALLVGGTGTGIALLVRHEPGFYAHAAVPPGTQRSKLCGEFQTRFVKLSDNARNNRQWQGVFDQTQINSYLEEDFVTKHHGDGLLPEGVSDPRVVIEPDRIRLGFRYGRGPFSTIISIDMRAWLVAKEPNVIALEFVALHAGAVPISAQSGLERVAEAARQSHIEVTWYRHDRHPVVVLRFQADRNTPTFKFQKLQLGNGVLSILGRSNDDAPTPNPSASTNGPG